MLERSEVEKAIDVLDSLFKRSERRPSILLAMAVGYLILNQPQKAKQHLRKILASPLFVFIDFSVFNRNVGRCFCKEKNTIALPSF